MFAVILLIVIAVSIFAGLPILMMWIVGRHVGTRTAIAIGGLAIGFSLYTLVDLNETCKAKPICPELPGSGACVFPCDAPAAVFIYAFIWLAGPISVALLAAATLFQCVKLKTRQGSS